MHILKICANLNCREVSRVSEELLAELNDKIPSPLNEHITTVPSDVQLNQLTARISDAMQSIAKHASISLSSEGLQIGEPKFEAMLREKQRLAAGNDDRRATIALNYIWQLNLFHMRAQDFAIAYCARELASFFKECPECPSEDELVCRRAFKKLMEFVGEKRNGLLVNRKLDKLVHLVSENHEPNSRGNR